MSADLIDEKAALVERVYSRLPYANQIKNLDIKSEDNAIRFDWRGTRYRVSTSGHTEEVEDGILVGNDKAILMQALFQRYLP